MSSSRCCCFRLQTGGLIIGWLGVIGSVLYILRQFQCLDKYDACIDASVSTLFNLEWIASDTAQQTVRNYVLLNVWISFILCLINLVTSALLIRGLNKERHLLLRPWLFYSVLAMFLFCINMLHVLIIGALGLILFMLIADAIGIGITFYCSYVIYSLYKEIQTRNKYETSFDAVLTI